MKTWKKILYEDQSEWQDNYIHKATFLKLKQINANTRTYSFWNTVFHSGIIIHQLSSVIIFGMIYVYLKYDLVDADKLLVTYFLPLIITAYVWKMFNNKKILFETLKNDFLSVIKFVSFVFGLCPILSSLTFTISSDTIYAICAFMLFINLIFHDYGVSNTAVISKTLSFNAALFSAVCLTSRFNEQNTECTFTLVSISFILFIMWPNYRKYLQEHYKYSLPIITIISLFTTLFALISMRFWSYACLYLISFLIITIACPFVLIKLQPFKRTIHGPWDEAIISN